jgi:hypothetical protein
VELPKGREVPTGTAVYSGYNVVHTTTIIPHHLNYIRNGNGGLSEKLNRNKPSSEVDHSQLIELNIVSLKELGWIPEGALESRSFNRNDEQSCFFETRNSVNFSNHIKKGYGYLAMELMFEGVNNYVDEKVFNEGRLQREIKTPNNDVINKIRNLGEACIKNSESKDIFRELSIEEYRVLRKDYLNFSATEKGTPKVNAPHFHNRVLMRHIINDTER